MPHDEAFLGEKGIAPRQVLIASSRSTRSRKKQQEIGSSIYFGLQDANVSFKARTTGTEQMGCAEARRTELT